MRRAVVLVFTAVLLAGAAPAAAAPDCVPGRTTVRPLLTGQGVLESVIVDDLGRLLYTDTTKNALMVLTAPGATPVALASVQKPGGLALDGAGGVLVGEGNGFQNGLVGNVAPGSRLLRVNLTTGATTVYVEGLQMANGVVRSADGTVYASNDVGLRGIDKIGSGGTVRAKWAPVVSANGLALSPGGGTLFAAQTFVPAAIQGVTLSDPEHPWTAFRAGLLDIAAGLDGMAADQYGRLVVAANGGGQVWRVSNGRACVLGRNLLLPSAVAVGHGDGPFGAGRVFVVTFSGVIAEVPA